MKEIIKLRRELEGEIRDLMYLIADKKKQVIRLNEYICENCEHKWVNGYVDCLESSRIITYCGKCESSK